MRHVEMKTDFMALWRYLFERGYKVKIDNTLLLFFVLPYSCCLFNLLPIVNRLSSVSFSTKVLTNTPQGKAEKSKSNRYLATSIFEIGQSSTKISCYKINLNTYVFAIIVFPFFSLEEIKIKAALRGQTY